jgi:uncharacterized membrane protein
MLRFEAIREYLRSSLWFIPLLFAIGAVVLAAVLLTVDSALAGDLGPFSGTAEGARSVLSTIAQSMLSFTVLVFTVTMLVLQLASNQLSPRVMRTFLRDRGNQVVLGLFVATFVYTLVVLRDVRTPGADSPGFVPGLAVSTAFVLLLTSVLAFIYYIDHMAHAIRATTVMDSIANETHAVIDRAFPEALVDGSADEPDPDGLPRSELDQTIDAAHQGVLVAVDDASLLELASVGDRAVVVMPTIGESIQHGSALFRIRGHWDGHDRDRLTDAVTVGRERTLQRDPGFGIRQLVDIALRALSPGVNDPTTAVQALDRIEGILRRLATRRFPPPVQRDEAGVPRLRVPQPDWPSFVRLATEEIRLAAVGQPVVERRLRRMLDGVAACAPEDRRLAVWAAMEG